MGFWSKRTTDIEIRGVDVHPLWKFRLLKFVANLDVFLEVFQALSLSLSLSLFSLSLSSLSLSLSVSPSVSAGSFSGLVEVLVVEKVQWTNEKRPQRSRLRGRFNLLVPWSWYPPGGSFHSSQTGPHEKGL